MPQATATIRALVGRNRAVRITATSAAISRLVRRQTDCASGVSQRAAVLVAFTTMTAIASTLAIRSMVSCISMLVLRRLAGLPRAFPKS